LRRSLMHNLRQQPDGNWVWKYDRRRFSKWVKHIPWSGAGSPRASQRLPADIGGARCRERRLPRRGWPAAGAASADGRYVTIPKAGHTVQGDNPKDLAAALREFLGA